MTEVKLYEFAYDFLLKRANITKAELDRHLKSEYDKPDDLKLVYKGLCISAQEKQMSVNVIGNAINGIDSLKTVLSNFDPHHVARAYQISDELILLSEIEAKLNPKGKIRKENRSIWPQYCKSIIASAHFLSKFRSANDFYDWADFFVKDQRATAALPLMISVEIAGIGFSLACNFLKEIGYAEYGKPDVYTIRIFQALGLIDPSYKGLRLEYHTLKTIEKIATANNITSFAVDKIFWLIGSGKFHVIGKVIPSQEDNFIMEAKKH